MTIERRREIFAKDFLTVCEIEELLGVDYQTAARIVRNIRRISDRLGIRGKIHVQDYLDYYKIPPDRYYTVETFEKGETNNENT